MFRTNCVDNQDRTNAVQSTLAREVLNAQLLHAGVFQRPSESIADPPTFRQVFNHGAPLPSPPPHVARC